MMGEERVSMREICRKTVEREMAERHYKRENITGKRRVMIRQVV